jgi:drug/metabolite transporter, DME family
MSVPTRARARARRAVARTAGGHVDVLLAACLWGTTGTVRTAVDAASDVSIAAVRIVVGGLALLAVAAGTLRGDTVPGGGLRRLVAGRRNRLPIVAGAAAVILYQTAFFSAAARTGVAVGTVVTIGSAPAFAGVLGLATGRTPLTGRWLLATAGAVTGCAALVGGGHAGADPVGVGLALLSGLSYAVYATVASVLVGRAEEERAVTGALFGVAATIVLPAVLAGVGGSAAWALSGRGALVALYLGAVATGVGYLLFARGLRTTPATTATTLTLAEPAVAAVLGVVVLGEALGAVALAGIALLALSLLLLLRHATPAPPDRRGRGPGDRAQGRVA